MKSNDHDVVQGEEEKKEQREKVLLFYSAFGLYTFILQEFTSEF